VPIEGVNPALLQPMESRVFEMDQEEEQWIVESIRAIRRDHPELSIAVLPYSNEQANRVTGRLQHGGIPAISLSDRLHITPVFKVLLAYLHLLSATGDCDKQIRFYEVLMEARRQPINPDCRDFLATRAVLYQPPETLPDEFLQQLYYDLIDFGRDALGGNLSGLLIRLTDHLFDSVEDRSNGYLCALQAKEILASYHDVDSLSPLEIVIDRFEALQRSRTRKQSFSDLLQQSQHGFVQVMTLHKAKGQEFDVVFLPFMVGDKRTLSFDDEDKLVMDLDRVLAGGHLAESYAEGIRRMKAEERARLVYVGITRARRALFISSHTQACNRFGRLEKLEPSVPYRVLSRLMTEREVPVG
jgi:hypothetical protein